MSYCVTTISMSAASRQGTSLIPYYDLEPKVTLEAYNLDPYEPFVLIVYGRPWNVEHWITNAATVYGLALSVALRACYVENVFAVSAVVRCMILVAHKRAYFVFAKDKLFLSC